MLTLLNSLVDVSNKVLDNHNVRILVDDIPINEFLRSDIVYTYGEDFSGSWLSSVESKVEIPEIYKEFLEKYKGTDIRKVKDKLVHGSDDIFNAGPRFPLVLLFYLTEMKDTEYLVRFMDEVMHMSYFTYIYDAIKVPYTTKDINDYWGLIYTYIGRFSVVNEIASLRKLVIAAEKMTKVDNQYFIAAMVFMAGLLMDDEAINLTCNYNLLNDRKLMKDFAEVCMGIDHALISKISNIPLVTMRKI